MLLIGSRGALVAAGIYAIALLLITGKNKKLILLVLIVLAISSGIIISLLNTLSENMGVTSRTMNLLLQGGFIQSQSRYDIYSMTWKSILDNPFYGSGLYGDRVILHP